MPLTILVVDDDLGTRLSISDYLELAGYSVIMAENGHEALEMVEQYQPHLLVTDVTMPRMNGYTLVQQVRQRPQFRLLPVLFLTARTNTEERIRGYQLGCDVYLPKPFELEELGAVIRNLLERSQIVETEWRQWAQQSRPGFSEVPTHEGTTPQPTATAPTTAVVELTPRETEVLALLTQGLSNAQIGDRLHLSPRTIEKYVSNLLRKTESNNRAELVRFAIEQHLVV